LEGGPEKAGFGGSVVRHNLAGRIVLTKSRSRLENKPRNGDVQRCVMVVVARDGIGHRYTLQTKQRQGYTGPTRLCRYPSSA